MLDVSELRVIPGWDEVLDVGELRVIPGWDEALSVLLPGCLLLASVFVLVGAHWVESVLDQLALSQWSAS